MRVMVFCKQKTAYEVLISDWSSDGCSSGRRVVGVERFANLQDFGVGKILDAAAVVDAQLVGEVAGGLAADAVDVGERDDHALVGGQVDARDTCHVILSPAPQGQIGRASCRERVGQYV